MDDNYEDQSLENKVQQSRCSRDKKIKELSDFEEGYTVSRFLVDLEKYFEGEVDFNLDKIREKAEEEGNLKRCVSRARQNQTHPVVEFIREIFKDLNRKE